MKLKMMQQDGATVLVVSGTQQELIISEESGCFTLELLEKACNNTLPVLVQEDVLQEVPEEVSQNVQEEGTPEAAPLLNAELFRQLAQLRKELANADKVPPYMVFHDKTLHEMASKMPANLLAMGNISGVGQAKLDKYGPAFLDVINSSVA